MKKKFKRIFKKGTAIALTAALTIASLSGLEFKKDSEKAYASTGLSTSSSRVVFAEGYGTGKDFSSSSWLFDGQAMDPNDKSHIYELTENAQLPSYAIRPNIVENNHSSAKEPIIRLINGVKGNDGIESGDSYNHYRSGEAFLKNGITFNSQSKFSMKFTFSMPDAVVNTSQTGGAEYAREYGGDGIAFVMTTNPTHNTQAGSGIGYQGILNSVAIEIDSFFNGAYCDMNATTGTSYYNWEFDNQLYFHKKWQYNNLGNEYINPQNPYQENGEKEYVQYRNYNHNERFDHIGITLNGDVKNHIAKYYINNIDPTEIETKTDGNSTWYEFKNLAYFNSSFGEDTGTNIESDESDCATRFTDKNVNTRLFTVWVDYDGTNMYVRYANGNFTDAVRPTNAIITQQVDMSSFNDKTVYMGFTSAVGSSKANHTIHSFMFMNEYEENGVSTSYTEKHYVETPDATSDFITVSGKKYVLKDTIPYENVTIGAQATAKDLTQSQDSYKTYELVDYSSNNSIITQYPTSTNFVKADGSTTLYRFYDLKPTYTVEYWLEVDAGTTGAIEVEGKYFKLDSTVKNQESTGTQLTTEYNEDEEWFAVKKGNESVENTKRWFNPYEISLDITNSVDATSGTVAADSSLVFKYYYTKVPVVVPTYNYTVEYYVEINEADKDNDSIEIGGKWYSIVTSETEIKTAEDGTVIKAGADGTKGGVTEDNAKVTDTYKALENYKYNHTATTTHRADEGTVSATGLTIKLFYDSVKTEYTEKHYVETPDATGGYILIDGKKYVLKDTIPHTNVTAGAQATAKDLTQSQDIAYAIYKDYELADYSNSSVIIQYPTSASVKEDGTTTVYQFYNLKPVVIPTYDYTVEYYIQISESDKDSNSIKIGDKWYSIVSSETETKIAEEGTLVQAGADGTKGGVTEDSVKVTDTYKAIDKYKYNHTATTTNGADDGIVSGEGLTIKLFYDAVTTKYTEIYYVEIKDQTSTDYDVIIDGVKYEEHTRVVIENVPFYESVEVTDKSDDNPFDEYELITLDGQNDIDYPTSVDDIDDDGNTKVYQVYGLVPEYTVKYYLEVESQTTGAIKVGDKYYVLQTADTVTNETTNGTVIKYYKDTQTGKAGVIIADSAVANTLKSYTDYEFSVDSTVANGKHNITVSRDSSVAYDKNVIELFFDIEQEDESKENENVGNTEYKEKYWVEDPNATEDYVEIEINGVVKKFVLKETNTIDNVDAGIKVEVTDKSDKYADYELVEVEIPLYPSFSNGIEGDGTTVVHQIYVLKEKAPQLGDDTNTSMYLMLLIMSGLVLVAMKSRKTEKAC